MHLLVQTSNRPICSHCLSKRFQGCQMWASVSQRKWWCQPVIIHSCSCILCSGAATHAQLEFLPTKEQQQVGEIHTVPHLGLWAWTPNRIPVLCDLLLGCQTEVNFSFVWKQTKKNHLTSMDSLSKCPCVQYSVCYLLLSSIPKGLIKTRILPGLYFYSRETENTDLFLSMTM